MKDITVYVAGTDRLTFLAHVFEELRQTLPGYFTLPEARDFDALGRAGKYFEDFTDEHNTCTFMLKGDVRLKFSDAPAKNTRIFLAVVDAEAGIDDTLAEYLPEKGNELFLIVPVISGAYNPREVSRMVSQFSELIESARGEYRGRCAVAVVPVQDDGEGADQPVRFMVNFLLNQGVLSSDVARRIAEGTLIDSENVSVLCGHDLLEPVVRTVKPEPPARSWNFAAVFAIALVLALGMVGGAWVYRNIPQKVVVEQPEPVMQAEPQAEPQIDTHTDEELAEARDAERKAVRERNMAVIERNTAVSERDSARNERDTARQELETVQKIADRLQKENDELRAEIQNLKDNRPKKDGAVSGLLKKIGL